MKNRNWVMTIIGAVSGVCFAALAARSLTVVVVPPHLFLMTALIYTAIGGILSYLAFRAAIAGRADEAGFMRALWGGFAGAVVGLVMLIASYAMFRDLTRVYVARPLGLHISQITLFRLFVASLFLGFAAGFALRTKKLQEQEDGEE